MDARGLVAFIVTVHEAGAVLGVLVGALIALIAAFVFRSVTPGKRAIAVVALALGAAAATFALTARVLGVHPLDVEVVRVDE